MADLWMVVVQDDDGCFFDAPECFDFKSLAIEAGRGLSRELHKGQAVILYSCRLEDTLHEYVPPGPEDRIDDTRQVGMPV